MQKIIESFPAEKCRECKKCILSVSYKSGKTIVTCRKKQACKGENNG